MPTCPRSWSVGSRAIVALFSLGLPVVAAALGAVGTACAAPWLVPDWAEREPRFPPGSLYWHTNRFRNAPVVYRTAIEVPDPRVAGPGAPRSPITFAGFRARASRYAFVFLNGEEVARVEGPGDETVGPFEVELTHLLRSGENVLAISADAEGLALEGWVGLVDGSALRFGAEPRNWRVAKLAPLTILEQHPSMRPDFDPAEWFALEASDRSAIAASEEEIRDACDRLRTERLRRWDEEARWRLRMLATKGIAIADDEARGWAGPGRLPRWLVEMAAGTALRELPSEPGAAYSLAEALSRYALLADEAPNLEGLAEGFAALGSPIPELAQAAKELNGKLSGWESAIRSGGLAESRSAMEDAFGRLREGRVLKRDDGVPGGTSVVPLRPHVLNRWCGAVENKFAWLDTTRLLDSDPRDWGLRFETPVDLLSSPLSPASLVTARGPSVTLAGWEDLAPLRVYKKPAVLGPLDAWAGLENGGPGGGGDSRRVTGLEPDAEGVVYARDRSGLLAENWVVLAHDMERGGGLPIEIVFLDAPVRIAFVRGDEGTERVRIDFEKGGARLFVLRPLKEWRGFLQTARDLSTLPLAESAVRRFAGQFRLWSRALLSYPIGFSEAAIRDPEAPGSIRVADVYAYVSLQDAWGTEALRLAPLPVLACYGLLTKHPRLELLSPAKTLGSWGVWGDHIACEGTNAIVYRVPLHELPRYGGFTSYCFGPTDIGEPGSLTEILSIRSTGANSFRPQHNQTGERAMQTASWCRDSGIQCVFNIDEKWVPDAVEHYRELARRCKDFPPWAIAYDLLNEPETREPRAYSALVKRITAAIREIDDTHPIYVETVPPWGPGAKPFPKAAFESLDPTGDRLTAYSFHDYEYRLPPRWPNDDADARTLLERWIPALRFSIDHRAPVHLGEFGGFEQTKQSVFENRCAMTMMLDFLAIFERFGWHWHYYANRGITRVRRDGSLQESWVQAAYRRHFERGTFNAFR